MIEQIKLELAEGVEEVAVSFWYKNPGGMVKEGEDLVELVTEKASFSYPSPVSGKLIKVFFKEGEKIKKGEVIAEVERE